MKAGQEGREKEKGRNRNFDERVRKHGGKLCRNMEESMVKGRKRI